MEKMVRSLVAKQAMLEGRISVMERLIGSGGLGDLTTIADPGPDGGGGGGWPGGWGGGIGGGIPIPYDPSPEDLYSLSRVQLESRLADILHVRKRLDALESMLKDAIARG